METAVKSAVVSSFVKPSPSGSLPWGEEPLLGLYAVVMIEGVIAELSEGDDVAGWIDCAGLPHSNKLHVIERITRPEKNKLHLDITIDDPQTLYEDLVGIP
jgi:hypothetical protein